MPSISIYIMAWYFVIISVSEIEGCIILGLNSHRHMNGFQEIADAISIQCLHRKLGYEN